MYLYCLNGALAEGCTVTFTCNGMTRESVTWSVPAAPRRIFSYWPGETVADGTSANLRAALIKAGKTEEEADRRIACEVGSHAPFVARDYTRFGSET